MEKTLRPRPSVQGDLDLIVLVDGSESVSTEDFNKGKLLCLKLSAKLSGNSQLGIIQFGDKVQIISPLSLIKEDIEKKVDGMTKTGGGANLGVAFEICYSELSRSKSQNNSRQMWIFTNGNFKQDPRNLLEKLIKEKQVTVVAIGIGFRVTMRLLNRVATSGCSFLLGDFNKATKLLLHSINYF